MNLRIITLVAFVTAVSALVAPAAGQDRNGQGGLRGASPEGRKLPGGLFNDEGVCKRELSGRVIISRKTEEKLKKEGKTPEEIAAIRSQGMSAIRKFEVVYKSLGKGDFHVVQVGKGKEASFIEDFVEGSEALYEYVEAEYNECIAASPDDPELDGQYHHNIMQSFEAWNITTGSGNVTVAICDTGLQPGHPDLEGNKLEGYNAINQLWENEGGDVSPVHPHGTRTAGCAAAIGNNSVGVSGVGWGFKHRMGRVTDESFPKTAGGATIVDCVMRMCELEDVKVVSVSFAGAWEESRRSAATYCKTQGALMVYAAGNGHDDAPDLSVYGEADDDDLIVVGASKKDDTRFVPSNFGRFVDVWAPGDGILTTNTESSYTDVSGTSFSSPLAAGLIALIWSTNLDLTPDQVENILKTTTDDVVNLQVTYNTAYGRINSFKAVQAAATMTSKYICTNANNGPIDADICDEGVLAGGECPTGSEGDSCGNGPKVCHLAACPGTGPTPPPMPPPTPPPTSPSTPGSCSCDVCDNGECCCGGTCVTTGKPSNRFCVYN